MREGWPYHWVSPLPAVDGSHSHMHVGHVESNATTTISDLQRDTNDICPGTIVPHSGRQRSNAVTRTKAHPELSRPAQKAHHKEGYCHKTHGVGHSEGSALKQVA